MELKTEFTKQKEARDLEIYNEYNRLMAEPNAMKMAVYEVIRNKYKIFANSTIWALLKRVEARQQKQQDSENN